MGILGQPVPKRIKIQDLRTITSWVLWTPFVVSVLLVILFALVRVVIHFLRKNEVSLRRWRNIRNSLAQITSGGEFLGVYSHQSIQQATSYNGLRREQSVLIEATTITNRGAQRSSLSETRSNIPDDKDLFMVERRIPAKTKGAWFNIYLLLLPLQVAIITMVIVHNIYTIQYDTETCESFVAIAMNLNESSYYDCKYDTLSDDNSEILRKCNNTDYGDKPISCTTYYYDPLPSHVILTILNSLLLHLTLAKGLIRFIIIIRYLSHKYGKSCREKCPCNVHGAFIVAMVLLSISGIVLIYYAVTESEHLGSDVTTSMVPFAFTAIATSIVLLLCGLFQPDLYKPFARCSYNVTDDPRSENDEITNNKNNQETDENDPMSNSWFCCSSTQTTPLTNYDEIE
jgi:hypothetical protein